MYKPPHERRAPGGWAVAEEEETQPRPLALGEEGTNEKDYTYTRTARAHFSRSRAEEERREEPLMNIADRGDRGSKAARIAKFLETYGGNFREREAEGSDTSPGLQWFP